MLPRIPENVLLVLKFEHQAELDTEPSLPNHLHHTYRWTGEGRPLGFPDDHKLKLCLCG